MANPFHIGVKDYINDLCKECRWRCKQSKAAIIIYCPQFEEKHEETENETSYKVDLDLLLIDK